MSEKQIHNAKINRITFLVFGIIVLLLGIAAPPLILLAAILLFLSYKTNKAYKSAIAPTHASSANPDAVQAIVDAVKADNVHLLTFSVAGVTFNNGRKSRQAILRKIKFHDAPFETIKSFDIEKYDYEGENAYSILVNGEQIGNIPKANIAEYEQYCDSPVSVTDLTITGGGDNINFGCNIALKFTLNN
ncbi:MAG: hypothetical protein EOM18_04905 [Clostridia bacterium]|nr:hypothetical protein [Clostridia bacterium]